MVGPFLLHVKIVPFIVFFLQLVNLSIFGVAVGWFRTTVCFVLGQGYPSAAMERLVFGGLAAICTLRHHVATKLRKSRPGFNGQPSQNSASEDQPTKSTFTLEEIVNIAGALAQHVRFQASVLSTCPCTLCCTNWYGFWPTRNVIYLQDDQKTKIGVAGKADTSPVTVADLAIQVLVTIMLKQHLGGGPLRLVGEEDTQARVCRKAMLTLMIGKRIKLHAFACQCDS